MQIKNAVKIYLTYLKDNARPNTARSFKYCLDKFQDSFSEKEERNGRIA